MDQFAHCPRCENRTLEQLKTYSHCIDCLYYEDRYHDSESGFYQAVAAESLLHEAREKVVAKPDSDDELAS